jgi:hypothetical protein
MKARLCLPPRFRGTIAQLLTLIAIANARA